MTEAVGAAGGVVQPHERRWPASLSVLVVLALQLALPVEMGGAPRYGVPAVELALLVPVALSNPLVLVRDSGVIRSLAVTLSVVVLAANAFILLLLVRHVIAHDAVGRMPPGSLVRAGVLIWITNVAAAAVSFWELDRGGPFARDPEHARESRRADLLFPQQTGIPGWDADTWRPSFGDYLFVAFTAATAFSPTDTLPLSFPAKLVTALTSAVSLVTIGILVARAVNAI